MRLPLATFLLAALPLYGCNALVDTGNPDIEFSSLLIEATEVPSANVSTVSNALFVDGVIPTPNGCQNVKASLDQGASQIKITIKATQTNSSCGTPAASYRYQALISRLDRGTFRVLVIHSYSTGRPDETVFDEEIILR